LNKFLDDDFIKRQWESGVKNFLLVHSDNVLALQYLESLLQQLIKVEGYDRLRSPLRKANNWDQYQETLAQINATVWFAQKGLLKEIEPALPHRYGRCDAKLSFTAQEMYFEVWAPQAFNITFENKKIENAGKVDALRKSLRWMSLQDAEHEIRNKNIEAILRNKTTKQLPPCQHGLLWIDGSKGWLFDFDVKTIAKRLFPDRPQMAAVMLWNSERGSQIGEAPFCYVNSESPFQCLTRKLLLYLERVDRMR
jgi:hypothetical protein